MAINDITKELTTNLDNLLKSNNWITAKEVKVRGCEGRPDIVAVRRKRYLRKEIRAYEVKVSRSDFLADVGKMKWKKYLSVCHKVYFAAPTGILRISDIPEGAGLIVFSEKGWSVIKSARSFEPPNLDADAILSILFANDNDQAAQRSLKERLTAENNITLKGVADKIGGEIARRVRGCTPETEIDADRIMHAVHKYFSNTTDAVQALKFAANFRKHIDVFESMASLLKEMTRSIDPDTINDLVKNYKKTTKGLVTYDNKLSNVNFSIKTNDETGDDLMEIENIVKNRFNTSIEDLLEVDGFPYKGGFLDG